jgi:pimeloyl-ACP methyl ester carboxylesterase
LSDVEAVTFQNRAGQKLFGTVHRPARARAGMPAVLLLSPGVKMRVGPGRLYLPLTDMLTAEGFTVLRFDFFGLGDSEGELAEKMLPDVYNHIEVGRYVDDTLAALDWLRDEQGFQRFVLGGLCGAAITALLAAQRDPRVEGLLSLGMTVTLASNAATPAKYMSGAELDAMRGLYIRKLLNPSAWLRFLTFRSDYSVAWHAMLRLIRKPKPKPVAASAEAPIPAEQRGNANPLFPPAYFEFLRRGGHALMLFSEKDRLYSEYEEKFVQPYAEGLKPLAGQIEYHLVLSANHVLSLPEWRREMVDTSRAWLHRRYPQAVA